MAPLGREGSQSMFPIWTGTRFDMSGFGSLGQEVVQSGNYSRYEAQQHSEPAQYRSDDQSELRNRLGLNACVHILALSGLASQRSRGAALERVACCVENCASARQRARSFSARASRLDGVASACTESFLSTQVSASLSSAVRYHQFLCFLIALPVMATTCLFHL